MVNDVKDTAFIFGNKLKSLLDLHQLQNNEFAKIIQVEPPTVTNYIKGNRFPNPDVLVKICDYFGCSIDWILGRSTNPNKRIKQFNYNDHIIEIEVDKDKGLDLETTEKLITLVRNEISDIKLNLSNEIKDEVSKSINQIVDSAIDKAVNNILKK